MFSRSSVAVGVYSSIAGIKPRFLLSSPCQAVPDAVIVFFFLRRQFFFSLNYKNALTLAHVGLMIYLFLRHHLDLSGQMS